MKLTESRAVRAVLGWLGVTLALKGLSWVAVWAGIPPAMVVDVRNQLAQLQSDLWALVMALIVKWAAEDFAKWNPVPPPERPQNVAGGNIVVEAAQPPMPAPPAEGKKP